MAEIKISGLPAASSANGTMEYETNDSGTSKKVTGSQLKTYVQSDLGTAAFSATGDFAPSSKGVTNGDTHDHSGGDGAQIAYSSLSGLPTLGTAAASNTTDFAPASKGVTNGDSHDHNGGDGAQIAYSSLSGLPTLGTISSQAANNVSITGGAIDGVTIGNTTAATIVKVDNLSLDGNTIASTDANGNVVIAPNGTGDVQVDAHTLRVGDSNANATITTNGTGDLILNTNAGTNSGSITIQDAANGNIILAPNGTGRVEVSGTSSNAGGINFYEDTDNGTNKALVTAPASLAADVTLTLPGTTSTLGYQNIPAVGTKTGSYSLGTGDVGKYVQVGSGGSITIPDATFAEGDVVSVFNNTSGNITITCTITTAYIAGTDSDKASVTLATRGVATILFISSTVCVITGNIS